MTFRLALGEHIGVIPKTHQTNVFEARMIRLSFFLCPLEREYHSYAIIEGLSEILSRKSWNGSDTNA